MAAEHPAKPHRAGRPYDAAQRRKATRGGAEAGRRVYIPAEVLTDAGIDPDQPIYYRTVGYQRSKRGHTVIVTLYTEP